jgi:hypothetical protein
LWLLPGHEPINNEKIKIRQKLEVGTAVTIFATNSRFNPSCWNGHTMSDAILAIGHQAVGEAGG